VKVDPIANSIYLVFLTFLAGVVVYALWHFDLMKMPELWTTILGVGLALFWEGRIEEGREAKQRRDRLREWATLIKNGAISALGHVGQTIDAGLSKGVVPTYKPDNFVVVMLDPSVVCDMLDERPTVDTHRLAVFELQHLGRKLDFLLQLYVQLQAITNTTQQRTLADEIDREVISATAIAINARVMLADLVTKCDQVLNKLGPS
jgi:hypothetical protein